MFELSRSQRPTPVRLVENAKLELQFARITANTRIMRTTIVIDDKLMADVLRATGLSTKREVVEFGLKTLLQLRQQAEIKKLRGKIAWEGDIDAMRRNRYEGKWQT